METQKVSDKFKDKYRIESTRLKNYDYSQKGMYFVTICTKNREHFFGEIINKEMKLSATGEIIKNEWLKTLEIRKNVILDEWIIMPNHLHGIIFIDDIMTNIAPVSVETHCNASLQNNASLQTPYKNKFGPQSHNLSAIIRGFKGISTKNIHIAGYKNFCGNRDSMITLFAMKKN